MRLHFGFWELKRAQCKQELYCYHYWTDFWHPNTSVSLTFKRAGILTLPLFIQISEYFAGGLYTKYCIHSISTVQWSSTLCLLCRQMIVAPVFKMSLCYIGTEKAAVRFGRTDEEKTEISVIVGSNLVRLISYSAIFQCRLHIGVDVHAGVCSQAYSGVTARSWNSIVIRAELIAWERTGSLLKGIICALVLLPSVWQEPSGWKGKAVEKETSVPDMGKSLFLFSPSQVSPGILISTIHLPIGR